MGLSEQLGSMQLKLQALNERVQALAANQSADVRAGLEKIGVSVIDGRASFAEDQHGVKDAAHLVDVVKSDGSTETLEADLVLVAPVATSTRSASRVSVEPSLLTTSTKCAAPCTPC